MYDKKFTVLIIDDIAQNIDLCTNVIGNVYNTKAATSAKAALKILEKTDVDLILLDIMMPEIDGYQLIQKIKVDVKNKDIPVIFLTAKTETEDESYGFSLGAVDYITKPIIPAILMARVSTHLTLAHQKKELKSKNEELEKLVRVLENKMERLGPVKSIPQPKTVHKTVPKKETQNSDDYFLEDHKLDLQELIEEIDSNINMILLRGVFDREYIRKTGDRLKRYGEILQLYPIFKTLGDGIYHFTQVLLGDEMNPAEENMEFIFGCMESFIYTLTHWHTQVFSKEIKDPNMFDNSMLADLQTLEMALTNAYDDTEDDIEFF